MKETQLEESHWGPFTAPSTHLQPTFNPPHTPMAAATDTARRRAAQKPPQRQQAARKIPFSSSKAQISASSRLSPQMAPPTDQQDSEYDRCAKYLSIVEPFPVEPPEYYTTLPRVSRPAFSDFESKHEPLPSYEPTVYKLGILYRKMEWISPFEMATQRHWKPYIVELNNTQLNFYQCPFKETDPIMKKFDVSSSFSSTNSHSLLHPYHHHHIYLKKSQGFKAPSALDPNSNIAYNYNEDNYRSVMSTKTDMKALKFFKSIGALESTKIVRSYTLQYGKMGLAIDYKKKSDVFRCRFETEQFLMDFPSTESMVEWYNSLLLGIDNSLDLSRREMPTYRTIPRRRRRRVRNHYKALNVSMGINLGAHYMFDLEQQAKRSLTSAANHSTLTPSSPSRRHSSSVGSTSDSKDKPETGGGGLLKFLKKRNSTSSPSTGSGDVLGGVFRKSRPKSSTINTTESSYPLSSTSISRHSTRTTESTNATNRKSKSNNIPTPSRHQEVGSLSYRKSDTHLDNEYADEEILDDEEYFEEEEDEDMIDDDEDEFHINEHLGEGDDEHDSDIETETSIITSNTSPPPQLNNNNINRSSESSKTISSIHSDANRLNNNTATTTPQSILSLNQPGESEGGKYQLRTYQEYIAKPSPHSTNTHTFPAQRKILRDSIRCMPPLTENERWAGKFVLLDITKNYKPQSRDTVDRHYQCLEVLTHIETVGHNYVHRFRRPLQEWIVTPSGLVPHINPNYNR